MGDSRWYSGRAVGGMLGFVVKLAQACGSTDGRVPARTGSGCWGEAGAVIGAACHMGGVGSMRNDACNLLRQ